MTCRGNSMLPVLPNPAWCIYRKKDRYAVGDVVFCKVKGRMIDAHFITKIRSDGAYLIANNHGHENGWTSTIYGYVIEASRKDGTLHYVAKPEHVDAN